MSELNFDINSDKFNPGYLIGQEDTEYLLSHSVEPKMLLMGDVPDRVDPRQTDLWKENWLKVEDQGQQGSCQGQALTECYEYCSGAIDKVVLQLSRQYAYIRSQQFDNINGDRGSTLSGGTKCIVEGVCLESIGTYAGNRYPGWGYITSAMKQNAENYRLKSNTNISREEDIKRYIGSGLGIVQIGIAWGNAMNPDSRGCIKSFSAGGGGHSVTFTGYVPDSDIGVTSSKGYWYLLKNSWSKRWGKEGFAYVDPRAVAQMLSHRWTVMVGRSDMESPNPRVIDVDFTNPKNSINY